MIIKTRVCVINKKLNLILIFCLSLKLCFYFFSLKLCLVDAYILNNFALRMLKKVMIIKRRANLRPWQ